LLLFLIFLKGYRLINDNFVKEIENQNHTPTKDKSYSSKQFDDLFEEILRDKQLLLFIQLVLYNFLRPIQVIRLKFEELKINEPVVKTTPPHKN